MCGFILIDIDIIIDIACVLLILPLILFRHDNVPFSAQCTESIVKLARNIIRRYYGYVIDRKSVV